MAADAKTYGDVLKDWIKENDVLFQTCKEAPCTSSFSGDSVSLRQDPLFGRLYDLMDQVEEAYEFDLQKMIYPDYVKFRAWQVCCGKNKPDKQLIYMSISFVLFCCLADKMLDSRRISKELRSWTADCLNSFIQADDEMFLPEKATALQKKAFMLPDKTSRLQREALQKKMLQKEAPHKDAERSIPEMTQLWQNISETAQSTAFSREDRIRIVREIRKAFLSELYMYENPLPEREAFPPERLYLVKDKSVAFEKAAFLMALGTKNDGNGRETATELCLHGKDQKTAVDPHLYGEGRETAMDPCLHGEAMETLLDAVADVYWLTDDLVDLLEDVRRHSRNSLLYVLIPEEKELDLETRVERAVSNIDQALELLKNRLLYIKENSGEEFGNIMTETVYRW